MNKKKIKISNQEILKKVDAFNSIVKKQLPVCASYAISKNIEAFNREIEFYNKERKKLVDKYSKKDDKGKTVKSKKGEITLEKPEEFQKEHEELLNIETEIEVCTCTIANLGDKEPFSPAEITAINFMLEDY
ncbi:hypothetical protein [Clostridium luticellarii]|jgi:L-lactate utilization protein LutC|uniref:Uncharacterized protein n=1 Tax=Clostridium luticellarii TaxID=1691940 RepID=A0A2T0BLH0_9CLOT|nr:hypothetical protein [Clostridium luticellarii]PRR84736.1 hypothetical protein CLLU_22750 [Clostridium luticellarii]